MPGTLPARANSLAEHIENKVQRLLSEEPQSNNIYQTMMGEVEAAIIGVVLKHKNGNQSRTAIVLGLSRGTLRKKMKEYDML